MVKVLQREAAEDVEAARRQQKMVKVLQREAAENGESAAEEAAEDSGGCRWR